MRRMPWMTSLWPGLPQLWTHGSWLGLAVALGMAAALDALLLATFGWSELIRQSMRIALWATFGGLWFVGVVWSVRQCRRRAVAETIDPDQDAFREALDHYLGGNYYQAEHLLEGLLQRNLHDVDARLMLATLLRHAGRFDEAIDHLDTLARLEGAGKWEWEIRHERELLAVARAENAAAA